MIGVVVGHVVVWVVLVLVVLVLVVLGLVILAVLRPSPKRFARPVGYGLGGLIGFYLVGRAVTEFFTVDYSNPASYRDSWVAPSLVGVFLVHAGPGAAIVIAIVVGYSLGSWPRSRRTSKANEAATREPQQQVR